MTAPLAVAICGGGNLGHALAAVLGGLPGLRVRLWTRRPEHWRRQVRASHRDLEVRGAVEATADPAFALAEAGLVLIAAPATAHRPILGEIAPHLAPDGCVGALPAVGGFNHLARAILPPAAAIFGSARAPYNCRIRQYGRLVEILGIVPKLQIAVEPSAAAPAVATLLEGSLGIPVEILASFVAVTLSPAATIFHPARLAELIGQRLGPGSPPGFYEDWGLEAAETFLACDAELDPLFERIGRSRHGMAAGDHYRTADPATLAARLRAMKGLAGIPVPLTGSGRRRRLDPQARFVTEDIPYGLAAAARAAALHSVPVPRIAALLDRVRGHFASDANPLALPDHLARLGPRDWLR